MATELTIPILPCKFIDDQLGFYMALGFEITYQQAKPNVYAVVRRGGIELHFFAMREYDPAQSYSTCLVLVSDIEGLYQAFRTGLRQHYGKVPANGIPRLTLLRDRAGGGRGFNVIDPGGNWIRITQKVEASEKEAEPSVEQTRLMRTIKAAEVLADSKGDHAAAAKLLDAALARDKSAPSIERVTAMIVRAGTALALNDQALARRLLAEVRSIRLSEDERTALAVELTTMDELEEMLE